MTLSDLSSIRINENRLWQSILEHGQIGATAKGGVCRLALTELDKQGRDLLRQWATDAGCTVKIDAIGNMFFRRNGADNTLPPVQTGSHLDTQPTGGKFDGIYGVLAGLEVIRTLNDEQITTRAPIELVVWTNEEGSRFTPIMMGSGVHVGALDKMQVLATTDEDGVTVKDALQDIDYLGTAFVDPHHTRSYYELHIEQGPVLEAEQVQIGVVTHALGQYWFTITLKGQAAHAGTTPMTMRRDALLASTVLIQSINQIALHVDSQHRARGTVGWIKNYPNSRNVIPSEVQLSVDFRAPTIGMLDKMEAELTDCCAQLGEQYGIDFDIKKVASFPPQAFDAQAVATVRTQTKKLGYSHMDIVSGAGHDAVYMARVAPTAMIFIPCKDGISHNELESIESHQAAEGCQVLCHTILVDAGISVHR